MLKCDGGYVCENLGGHKGEIKKVRISDSRSSLRKWNGIIVNYCETAIEEDKKKGFNVDEITPATLE